MQATLYREFTQRLSIKYICILVNVSLKIHIIEK